MAAVRIRILDEHGNIAPYAQLPVRLEASGAVSLVGPDTVTAEGGCCGCYLRSEGASGNGSQRITVQGMEPIVLNFEVRKETRV